MFSSPDEHTKMHCEPSEHFIHHSTVALQQIVLTAMMVAGFLWTKTLYDKARRKHARMTVVVIGAGPVGLVSVLIAAKNDHVRKIYLFEEMFRNMMTNKPYQLAFSRKSISFLNKYGVDFDSIEGCWDNKKFFTRVGVFQDYVLSRINSLGTPVDLRLGCKGRVFVQMSLITAPAQLYIADMDVITRVAVIFNHNSIKELERMYGRVLVIACDGTMGQASRILGLSDEFSQHSCKAFGAVASLDRPTHKSVPCPDRKFHNLLFDLAAYGGNDYLEDASVITGFTFKLFGSSRHRFMTLAIPKCDCPLVKTMRLVLDRSMMRNIFIKCFNTYRSKSEPELSESAALKHLKFSTRLFDFKVFQRLQTVAYFEEPDMFVIAEGDSARSYNFHTGVDINLSIKGLMSLPTFISMATWAQEEYDIMNAMLYKARHAEHVSRDFLKSGLKETLFTQQ